MWDYKKHKPCEYHGVDLLDLNLAYVKLAQNNIRFICAVKNAHRDNWLRLGLCVAKTIRSYVVIW